MGEIEAFGRLLEDTCAANKLSSSKVTKVRDEAMSCMHESKALAQRILEVNVAASPKTKLSALYLLDAVARHAQDIVKKGSKVAGAEGFDVSRVKAPSGSSAPSGTWEAARESAKAFLYALGDVVERIAIDAVQSVPSEQKEKALKVVDIWIRADTFDAEMLRDIKATAKRRAEAGARPQNDNGEVNSMPSPYGMMVMEDNKDGERGSVMSNASAAPGLPSSVLALLGGANKKPTGSSPSSANQAAVPITGSPGVSSESSSSTPSFDTKQLAILQQLAGQPSASTSAIPSSRQPQPGPPPPLPGRPPARPPNMSGPSSNPTYQQSPPLQMYNNSPPVGPQGPWQRPDSGSSQNRRSRSPSFQQGATQHQGKDPRTGLGASASGNRWPEEPRRPPPQAPPPPQPAVATGDLSQFDPSTFDPTDTKAWTAFAQMWQNSYGYPPSNQEVLMWMMMSGMQMGTGGDMSGQGTGLGATTSSTDGAGYDASDYHGQQQYNQNRGYHGGQGQSYGSW